MCFDTSALFLVMQRTVFYIESITDASAPPAVASKVVSKEVQSAEIPPGCATTPIDFAGFPSKGLWQR